LIKVQ